MCLRESQNIDIHNICVIPNKYYAILYGKTFDEIINANDDKQSPYIERWKKEAFLKNIIMRNIIKMSPKTAMSFMNSIIAIN